MTTQSAGTSQHARFLTVLLLCSAATLGACSHTTTEEVATTSSVPRDYRQRHPIVVQEADRSVEIFIGHARGGLTPSQRADVMAFARAWGREGTGGIIIDVPDGTANARAASDSLREIQSLFSGAGIPPRAVSTRPYRPRDPGRLATIKLNYPKITADAGPCGTWPDDLGPSSKDYLENRPWHNFGCAYQRNLAAMVDNPSDLVQPRPETPSYTPRRTVVLDKYRKGEPMGAINPDVNGKITDVGR
jgi:pilus assembly protein CpaD